MIFDRSWKLVLVAAAFAASQPAPEEGDVDLVWPNAESRANFDPRLARHHDEIRRMRPNILVLNLVNGLPDAGARGQSEQVSGVLREGSEYVVERVRLSRRGHRFSRASDRRP